MKKQNCKLIVISLLSLLITFLVISSCDYLKGPTGPQGEQGSTGAQGEPGNSLVNVIGWARSGNNQTTGDVNLSIYNLGVVPTVKINDITIYPNSSPASEYYDYGFPIGSSDAVNLTIDYTDNEGNYLNAHSSVHIPGNFYITDTDPDFAGSGDINLTLGDHLSLFWSNSFYADAYSIEFYLGYTYQDTSGDTSYYSLNIDPLVEDNFITFPTEQIFPASLGVSNLIEGEGYINVCSIDGPCQAGETGNVIGDGTGFFNGINWGTGFGIIINNSSPVCEVKSKNNW